MPKNQVHRKLEDTKRLHAIGTEVPQANNLNYVPNYGSNNNMIIQYVLEQNAQLRYDVQRLPRISCMSPS